MPLPLRKYTVNEIEKAYSGLRQIDSKNAIFFTDAAIYAISEIGDEFSLNFIESWLLVKLMNVFTFEAEIPASKVRVMLGRNTKSSVDPFPGKLGRFFCKGVKGYILSEEGNTFLSWYTATLKRVLTDREEFYRLKFCRWDKSEQLRRRNKKRFYKDLTEAEQIAVLRAYWSLPYRDKEEKRARLRARVELRNKYDLKPWDIINAIQAFGDVVKSIRKRPDLIGLYPNYRS